MPKLFQKRQFTGECRVLGLVLVSLITVSGAATLASAADPNSDVKWVRSVLQQLLTTSQARSPVSGFQGWPPTIEIVEVESDAEIRRILSRYNAFAYCASGIPWVAITKPLLNEYVEGIPDRLAFVLSHELAHLILGHVPCKPLPPESPFLQATLGREDEYAADLLGMQLALAAGYSNKKGLRVYWRMEELSSHSSLEAFQSDHPAKTERHYCPVNDSLASGN